MQQSGHDKRPPCPEPLPQKRRRHDTGIKQRPGPGQKPHPVQIEYRNRQNRSDGDFIESVKAYSTGNQQRFR